MKTSKSCCRLPRGTILIACLMLAVAAGGVRAAEPSIASSAFRFADLSPQSIELREGSQPVFVYHHGVIARAAIPADRARSSYFHPIYDLDGQVLTDDFPADHYHHRGLFWAWPHVKIGGREHDLWMLKGIRHQFERWLIQQAGTSNAVLGVHNTWRVGDEKVMDEKVLVTVHRAGHAGRAIDFDFVWMPLQQPITLAGAEGKSYGGLTLRFAPRTNTVITTPLGSQPDDLAITPLPWADLSAQFVSGAKPSGAAILVSPTHPDFPPTWLTRHYGVLCLGWPGVEARTFPPGKSFGCRYRLWIHRGQPTQAELASVYAAYGKSEYAQARAQASAESRPESLQARLEPDRVRVEIDGRLFTEYLHGPNLKYPYFYPLVGPRSARSVTAHQTEPYPHHSSLFFGCDRVNGGNYWQEGLERGRIVSQRIALHEAAGDAVTFYQECRWERTGAPVPFQDQRIVRVWAPSRDRRVIDFEVRLTALVDVRIERNNHSLFAARLAPDLAVTGGGIMRNAEGLIGEKETFGKPSPWMDYRGRRDPVVEGLTLFPHPQNPWSPAPWFTRDYGFISPTPMQWLESGHLDIPRGQSLRLRYRVLVHADAPTPAELDGEAQRWAAP